MKPVSPPVDAIGEMSGLIRVLGEADIRLKELTAGEVDAVMDSDGRSFLLLHAQDELRRSEVTRQAAILDALPAHIAVLDNCGFIVAVNSGWLHFAKANNYRGPGCGVGLDYTAVCDDAIGDGAVAAHQVAEGVRSVLAGRVKRFEMEYSCNSPVEERWFVLTVTPLPYEQQMGAVVMHFDTSRDKRGQENLLRFAAGMNATSDGICLIDRRSMRYVHVNDAACRMNNVSRDHMLAQGPAAILGLSRAELERTYDALIAGGESGSPVEFLRYRSDGSPIWVEVRRHALCFGDRWMIFALYRDVTERRQADVRIRQFNRLYAVLSGINTLIVHVRDRNALFSGACRIAVETGAFGMAWIGLIDKETMIGKVVASCGTEESYLKKIKFTALEGTADSEKPASRALRSGQAVVCNDIEIDPSLIEVRDDLLQRGYRSAGCFPITFSGHVEGVLVLFSEKPDVFDEAEMRLLKELAGDLSFAMDHIAKEEKLNYLAYYDDVTGLPNRNLFLERLAHFIGSADRDGHKLGVFLIDLERFRNINESLGRPAGDALLRQFAEWLTQYAGGADLLARLSGDLFAVAVPVATQHRDVVLLLEKAMAAFLGHSFRINNALFRISAKVGVALFPDDGRDADLVFRRAEAALKQAKVTGEPYLFHTQKMSEMSAGKHALENQLRQALENNEFVLHYQPKLNLATGTIIGAEALIRWNDPRTGLVPPIRFISILEETGLIYDVGNWALGQAVDDYLRWRRVGLAAVRIAVNVSPLQLRRRGFADEVRHTLGIDVHAAAGLELEITESMIMEDTKGAIATLNAIRALGVRVAIDDFGTGFSSLSYLSKLPVDSLKIDRSFVVGMKTGPQGLALVSTIITLAHSLSLNVVAEGVETEDQADLLRLLRCDEVQGFLFGKPVASAIFETRYLVPATAEHTSNSIKWESPT
jgi:diguanylate cyclase (GGDEF)-like protein/PAS domain S-box-containing protein